MGYRIEDGRGARLKAELIENRLRTIAIGASLMNHISQDEVTSGPIGVYSSRANALISAGSGIPVQYILNNDPLNVMIIDRIYINAYHTAGTLPDSKVFVDICCSPPLPPITFGGAVPIQFVNENLNNFKTNTPPNATLLATAGISTANLSTVPVINRMYPTLGDNIEMIRQGSDPLILGLNEVMLLVANNLSAADFNIDTFVKFAMYPLRNMG